MRFTDGSRAARLALAADLAALVLFVIAGSRFHQDATRLQVFMRNAVPFAGAWLFFAAILGTYRPPSFVAMLKTWAATVPLGLLLRAVWMDAPIGPWNMSFVYAATGFTLLFLVGGRALVALVGRRAPAKGRRS